MARNPSPPQKLRGSLALAAAAFDQGTARVHELHRAISDMPFAALRPVGGEATEVIHNGITDGVYGAVRATAAALFKAAELGLAAATPALPVASPTPPSPLAGAVVGAVSGLIGDAMVAQRNPLAPRLGVYVQGECIAARPAALAQAFPAASGKLVVFLHGLCCTEDSWGLYAEQSTPYPQQLAQQGYTPLMLRYNSGLHISANGRSLARHLQRVVQHWPVPVTQIVLVGHSMGGLVARSALHSAQLNALPFIAQVSDVFCLGSPHLGSPLARVAAAGATLMDKFPLSRPLAKVLNVRSVGIRDLNHGYIVNADWKTPAGAVIEGGSAEAAQGAAALTPIPRLAHARYHFIGATVAGSPEHPIGQWLGDGLVQLPSSTAAQLADADTAVLCATHHLRLLNHPMIYNYIAQRLGHSPSLAATG